MSAAEVKLL